MTTAINRKIVTALIGAILLQVAAFAQTPLGTAFTYQGRLQESGAPANGVYDLSFELYGDAAGTIALGSDCLNDVAVADGLFTVELDFGAAAFAGDRRWMELSVRADTGDACNANLGTYTTLAPLQEITPAPHARYAVEAGSAVVDNVDDADADPSNEIETWTTLAGIPAGFADDVDDVDDADADPTNELQDLSLATNSLSLTGDATPVDLSGYLDNTDAQNLANVLGQGNDAGGAGMTNLGSLSMATANPTLTLDNTLSNSWTIQNVGQNLEFLQETFGLTMILEQGSRNVGIGIANPAHKLDVVGNVNATTFTGDGSGLTGINVNDADADPTNERNTTFALNGTSLDLTDSGGTLSADLSPLAGGAFGDGHSLDADDGAPVDAVYVDASGNVGVGITTPGALLHVNGGDAIVAGGTSNYSRTVTIGGARQSEGVSFASLQFQNTDNDGAVTPYVGAMIAAHNDGGLDGAELRFLTAPGMSMPGNFMTSMTIDGNGRVGIGATAPGAKLEVAGTAGVDGVMFPDGTLQTTAFGGSVDDADADPTNELQNLFATVAGNSGSTIANAQADTLTIAGAGIATTSVSGDTLTITATEVDGSVSNELQTLSGTGSAVTLSNGGGTLNISALAASDGSPVDALVVDANGNVGIGIATPGAVLNVSGNVEIGTANCVVSGTQSAIVACGSSTTVTGATSGAFGASNVSVSGNRCVIVGGLTSSIVNGGTMLDCGIFAAGLGSSINSATGSRAVILGGGNNQITGTGAFEGAIIAGNDNAVSAQDCIVAGGDHNSVSGLSSGVFVGASHAVPGRRSAIAGGNGNTATSNDVFIGGGTGVTARGANSGSLGGTANVVEGENSVALGGVENLAKGDATVAMGRGAKAMHDGSFVWASGLGEKGEAFASSRSGEFAVQALGGAMFATSSPVDGKRAGSGIRLEPGAGAWTALCDVESKENFAPVDSIAILERVAAMPIATWNWKAQGAAVSHLGPTAQDFSAAFGLGTDDKGIATVDADGVALAAIQGLNAKLRAELDAKQAEIDALNARLERLEGLLLKRTEDGK
jgi:hypothetical protein